MIEEILHFYSEYRIILIGLLSLLFLILGIRIWTRISNIKTQSTEKDEMIREIHLDAEKIREQALSESVEQKVVKSGSGKLKSSKGNRPLAEKKVKKSEAEGNEGIVKTNKRKKDQTHETKDSIAKEVDGKQDEKLSPKEIPVLVNKEKQEALVINSPKSERRKATPELEIKKPINSIEDDEGLELGALQKENVPVVEDVIGKLKADKEINNRELENDIQNSKPLSSKEKNIKSEGKEYSKSAEGSTCLLPIKYIPNDLWLQTTDLKTYPIVNMPVKDALVLLPLHGKVKTKGISEEQFKSCFEKYFPNKTLCNQHLEFKGAKHDYEPDLIFKEREFNLFVDIEIDEPYSGASRKPMHYTGSYDIDRDHYFNKYGWVVIRFAEYQIVKEELACIKTIAKVVDSLIGSDYANRFENISDLIPIPEWNYDQAKAWAEENYRESYLGITFKSTVDEDESVETEINIEKESFDDLNADKIDYRDTIVAQVDTELEEKIKIINEVIKKNSPIIFNYSSGEKRIVQPSALNKNRSVYTMVGNDIITLNEQTFELRLISDIDLDACLNDKIYTNQDEIKQMIEFAMDNDLYILMKYFKYSGESDMRTISSIQYTDEFKEWGYETGVHIKAFCNLRNEERSFKIERIAGMAVLNFSYS